MSGVNHVKFFRKRLLEWFQLHERDFPWRRVGASNYELIMSEILLQRTRAETVSKHYHTFFGRYPGWDELTTATDQDLALFFRPLGLHTQRVKRVRRIIEGFKLAGGKLPRNLNELNDSPFAALYISNAYELFMLKRRAPLFDVNMVRVLSRFFGFSTSKDARTNKLILDLSRRVTNVVSCKELNWAILDLGALVCKAKSPRCHVCYLKSRCQYFLALNITGNID